MSTESLARPTLNRETVLAAARQVVAEEGHEALSLRRLAKGFGVTAPALYAHVETKQELLSAVAADGFGELKGLIDELDDPSPSDRIRSISRTYVAFARQNPELWRLMNLFPADLRSGDGGASDSPGGQAFAAAARSVFDAMACGEMQLGDPWLTAIAFRSAIHGLTQAYLTGSNLSQEEEAAVLEIVVEGLLAGLAPQKGT